MSNMIAAKRVVICELQENTTAGGLHLAQGNESKKPELGKIVVIGEGKKPVEFVVGDTIVFRKYSDNRILVLGQEFNFIDFKDIMAVLPKEKK